MAPGLYLAQSGFGIIDPPTPNALPAPPFFDHYLLENPWPLIILFGVIGTVAFLRLHASGRTRPAAIFALCVMLAAGGEWVLASSVETSREQIAKATESLVEAAVRSDPDALDHLLSDELSLFRPGGGPALGKDETLKRVRTDLGGMFKVSDWAVLQTQSMTESPRSGVTQARLRITLEMSGFPNISWWRIDWRKGADGAWRAVTIDPISVTPEVRSQLR